MNSTDVWIRDLPDGGSEGGCRICGQHLQDGKHTQPTFYTEFLATVEDEQRFQRQHEVET